MYRPHSRLVTCLINFTSYAIFSCLYDLSSRTVFELGFTVFNHYILIAKCFSFELASLRLILFCFTIHISSVFSRAAGLLTTCKLHRAHMALLRLVSCFYDVSDWSMWILSSKPRGSFCKEFMRVTAVISLVLILYCVQV